MKFFLLVTLAVSALAFKIEAPHGSIIDGELALPGEFKYMIDVRTSGHYCGGSLYNENFIITAAHCATLFASSYTVVAGELNLAIDNQGEQSRDVDLIIQHEEYTSSPTRNDIALMRVSEPFVLGENITAIALNREFVENGTCTVAGWGSINGNPGDVSYPSELYKVDLPIVSDDDCSVYMSISDKNICAGDIEGGGSSCYADSGGPLVLRRDDVDDVLAGIVSFGPEICGSPNYYSVYCEVAHFVQWVEATVAANS